VGGVVNGSASVQLWLSDGDVDRIARRVVELLVEQAEAEEWIEAAEVARRFGVSRGWVYEHKEMLGVRYTGDGPRPRQRYNVARVRAALEQRERENRSTPKVTAVPHAHGDAISVELIPIKGQT